MKKKILIVITVSLLFAGCTKEGLDGKNSLIDIINEPIGENCSFGGYKIVTGIDLNNNNILDENEIQNTEYVCNGHNGQSDKQLTFKLFDLVSSPNGGNLETIHEYTEGYGGIVKFNINNFPEIDSAILVVYDITTRDSYNGNLVSETLKIELYDCKNSQVINNSEIISGEIVSGSYVSSINIIDEFPNQDIELGIKLTKSSDYYAETKDIVLILYRK